MRIRGCRDEHSYSVISLLLLATTRPQSICNALLNDSSPLSPAFKRAGHLKCWRHASRPFPILHIPRHQHNAYSLSQSSFLAKWLHQLGSERYCFTFCFLSQPPCFAWTFSLRIYNKPTNASHAGPSTNQPFARDHQDGTRVPCQLWCFVAATVTIYPGAVTREFLINLFLYPSPLFRLCREMVIQVRVNRNG